VTRPSRTPVAAVLVATLATLLLAAGCPAKSPSSPESSTVTPGGGARSAGPKTPAAPGTKSGFVPESPDLKEGQQIDAKFTCDGEDRSPALKWPAPPAGTKSLALVMDDPDAPSGTFTHWLLYGVEPSWVSIGGGLDKAPTIRKLGMQGKNDFDRTGYGGPCPPAGKPHHYRFKLFALKVVPSLGPGASKEEVQKAIEGNVLAQGVLTATYKRKE
jgi:Raf kinase inhibitor-like YbhB/YbcL family protein